ncbi:aminotransferase class V-fold PLP-dependent enzyme [Legionella quinlivanii]|uniref:aminotransferase class V-fold PLP-dependent enzyme n=1 Tax=Legionella quinlivanii TaxID=45073 RepID=UPI00224327A1|nr:aminotransferase class V-fold PLP-dependent enzyme [Legionella quinlivanii]MCW8451821.1 aminotransferase class V-fold PLP-dependent enzyme [Legionella quinlivanii]
MVLNEIGEPITPGEIDFTISHLKNNILIYQSQINNKHSENYMKKDTFEHLWRSDFPILNEENHNQKFIYMDSASTSLKPAMVIDAVNKFYTNYTSNISCSSHFLSEKVIESYDLVLEKVASFVNARKHEIIFTHNWICLDTFIG